MLTNSQLRMVSTAHLKLNRLRDLSVDVIVLAGRLPASAFSSMHEGPLKYQRLLH